MSDQIVAENPKPYATFAKTIVTILLNKVRNGTISRNPLILCNIVFLIIMVIGGVSMRVFTT